LEELFWGFAAEKEVFLLLKKSAANIISFFTIIFN
jgi:hypothetical protein